MKNVLYSLGEITIIMFLLLYLFLCLKQLLNFNFFEVAILSAPILIVLLFQKLMRTDF